MIHNGFVNGEIGRMAGCMDEEIMLRITGYAKKFGRLKFIHLMDEEDIRQEFLCETDCGFEKLRPIQGGFSEFCECRFAEKIFHDAR
jgi:hypothetical protein